MAVEDAGGHRLRVARREEDTLGIWIRVTKSLRRRSVEFLVGFSLGLLVAIWLLRK